MRFVPKGTMEMRYRGLQMTARNARAPRMGRVGCSQAMVYHKLCALIALLDIWDSGFYLTSFILSVKVLLFYFRFLLSNVTKFSSSFFCAVIQYHLNFFSVILIFKSHADVRAALMDILVCRAKINLVRNVCVTETLIQIILATVIR